MLECTAAVSRRVHWRGPCCAQASQVFATFVAPVSYWLAGLLPPRNCDTLNERSLRDTWIPHRLDLERAALQIELCARLTLFRQLLPTLPSRDRLFLFDVTTSGSNVWCSC